MIHRTVEDYAAAQKDLCVQNDFIPNSLFQEYGVNRACGISMAWVCSPV